MNIIEVKNNLVKFGYEEDLKLAELVMIKDSAKSYIAQIIHLDSTRTGKSAIGKLVFNFDGHIRPFDGSVPSVKSAVVQLDSSFTDSLTNSENPLLLGKIAGSDSNLVVDFDTLSDNPIILSEKYYITKYLLNNIALQLQARHKKLVVFDTYGIFNAHKLTLSKDFRLPLNNSGINYINDKVFADATAESKVMAQSIFNELGEYAKTVEYIPFDTFKGVIDAEFERTKLIQLVILKNKLKQIRDWGIFAQTDEDLTVLKSKLAQDNLVVINISKFNKSIQTECIKYVYSILKSSGQEFYVITPLAGDDKQVLNEIFDVENVRTTVVCDYDYANLNELKKSSKNMIMFTPLKQQKDFGGYNIFLQRLAEDEFIAYGKMTKFIPIIGKLYQMNSSDIQVPEQYTEPEQTVPTEAIEEVAEITPELPTEAEQIEETAEEADVINEPTVEEIFEEEKEETTANAEIAEETITPVLEEAGEEPIESEITEPKVEVEEVKTAGIEEIGVPEVNEIQEPEVSVTEEQITAMTEGTIEEVVSPAPEPTEQISNKITEAEEPMPEPAPTEVQADTAEPQSELNEALSQVPDIEDEEELSDDDLDMIEKLSKPDSEIEAINPKIAQNTAVTEAAETPVAEEIVQKPSIEPEPIEQPVQEPIGQAQEESEEPEPAIQAEEHQGKEEGQVTAPPQTEPLQTRSSTTPSVPEYKAEIPAEDKVYSDPLKEGDRVYHQEFGEGVVEKMINYGDKILCSINFTNVGRRLLNPEISEMRRI